MKTFLAAPETFGASTENLNLSIICADDIYYNLEALRLVFKNLGLLDYCHFVNDGKQVVDCCIKNVEESEEGAETVTIVIVDYEMPMMTGLEAIKEIQAFYSLVN